MAAEDGQCLLEAEVLEDQECDDGKVDEAQPPRGLLWKRSIAAVVLVAAAGAACALVATGGLQKPAQTYIKADSSLVAKWSPKDVVSSIGDVCREAMGFEEAIADGDSEGEWVEGLELAKAAGLACVEMTMAMEEFAYPVLLACGAVSVGADILSATENDDFKDIVNDRFDHFSNALGGVEKDIKESIAMDTTKLLDMLETIREEAHCSKVEEVEKLMRKVFYEYKDTVLRGYMEGADVNFYARLSDWRAEFDPPAMTQFVDDLQGCGAAPMKHLPAFLSARAQLFAMQSMFWRGQGEDQKLQSISQDLHHDMKGFAKVQADKLICVSLESMPRELRIFNVTCSSCSRTPGDLKDLPRSLTWAKFGVCDNIRGNLKDLPRSLIYANFMNAYAITGDLKDLPRSLTYAMFTKAAGISGDLSDLPQRLTLAHFWAATDITGDLEDLPRSITGEANFCYAKAISGNIKDLPRSMDNYCCFAGTGITGKLMDLPRSLMGAEFDSEGITGDLKDLPRSMLWAYFWGSWAITGSLSDLPRSMHRADFRASEGVTGNIQDLPLYFYKANFHASEDIKGDISDLPVSIRVADFHSAKAITGETSDLPSALCLSDFSAARNAGHVTGHPPNFQYCDYYYEEFH